MQTASFGGHLLLHLLSLSPLIGNIWYFFRNDDECEDDDDDGGSAETSQRGIEADLVYSFEKWSPTQAQPVSPDRDKLLFNCRVIGKAALEAWRA